jgi:hypothetical protein
VLGLLIYSDATGVFGSRRIEQMTYENVAVRLLCGDTHPDHDTICSFRRQNRELLSRSFAQVLELAARCRVLKVGDLTVAIDGTKVLANANRHSAVSYGRAGEQLRQVELEIEQLLAKAEADDAQPLQDGLSLEGELARRHERKARLPQARAEIEARAFARAQQERARKAPDQPGPPAPPASATFTERMAHRPATAAGRTRYKLRQQTVEPVFGIIKQAIGFRRFMLRDLEKVSLEWILVTLSYNLRRLHTRGAVLKAA